MVDSGGDSLLLKPSLFHDRILLETLDASLIFWSRLQIPIYGISAQVANFGK